MMKSLPAPFILVKGSMILILAGVRRLSCEGARKLSRPKYSLNDEIRKSVGASVVRFFRHSCFDIHSSFDIRASSFPCPVLLKSHSAVYSHSCVSCSRQYACASSANRYLGKI